MTKQRSHDAEFAAVAQILRTVCRSELPRLTAETRLDELPRMDSLLMMQVVAMVEEYFAVEIDLDALEHLATVHDIAQAAHSARQAVGTIE
ncbi:MAG TPA: acyl carrier protein [Rhodopila sp.]|nr:acyl carrier protein [Rhodopila sp.]